MGKKFTIGFMVGIVLIIGLLSVFLIGKNTKILSDVKDETATNQKQLKVIQPSVENNTILKSCASGGVCEDGHICYHSQYSGMGPNGVVNGEEEGDLLCHKSCVSDSDCGIEKCKTVETLGGGIVDNIKFCAEK